MTPFHHGFDPSVHVFIISFSEGLSCKSIGNFLRYILLSFPFLYFRVLQFGWSWFQFWLRSQLPPFQVELLSDCKERVKVFLIKINLMRSMVRTEWYQRSFHQSVLRLWQIFLKIVPFEAELFGQCLLSHVNNGSDWTTVICTDWYQIRLPLTLVPVMLTPERSLPFHWSLITNAGWIA